MHLIMADQGCSSGSSVMRDYRKGNWTVSETMVLIEAKKMDDERRMKRNTGESSSEGAGRSSKPTELRWKWVEDYCWRKGCLRSQNQCNDKWDNLMRDYKKVKDYERRIGERSGGGGDGNTSLSTVEGSYWKLEKNERKDKNLPSNMFPQIYQALVEVVEKKGTHHKIVNIGGGGSIASNPNIGYLVQPSLSHLLQHHQVSDSIPSSAFPPPLPQPPPPPIAQAGGPPLHPRQSLPTVDSDTSEHSDSPAKRRRRGRGGGGGGGGDGDGDGGGGGGGEGTSSSSHEVGSAISKSASIIAEALQASDERQEKRHRDLLSLQERRLKIEESKTEINRQGINGLVDAINKLANSILALASHGKNQSSSK